MEQRAGLPAQYTRTRRMVGSHGPACCQTYTFRGAHLTSTFHQNHRCMLCQPFDVKYFSTAPKVFYAAPAPAVYATKAPVVEYIASSACDKLRHAHISPDPTVYAAPAPVVEFIAPAPGASYATLVLTAIVAAPVVEPISPDPAVYAAKVPVVEYIAPAPVAWYATAPTILAAPAPGVEYISPDPTVHVAPAPVVEYISPDPAECAVAEYITPSPMEFVEAALHEIDEEFCRDDFEELCYVARMSRKRLWRRASGMAAHLIRVSSKSERTWRMLFETFVFMRRVSTR